MNLNPPFSLSFSKGVPRVASVGGKTVNWLMIRMKRSFLANPEIRWKWKVSNASIDILNSLVLETTTIDRRLCPNLSSWTCIVSISLIQFSKYKQCFQRTFDNTYLQVYFESDSSVQLQIQKLFNPLVFILIWKLLL